MFRLISGKFACLFHHYLPTNTIALATSITFTRLFNCLPPPNKLIVPLSEVNFAKKVWHYIQSRIIKGFAINRAKSDNYIVFIGMNNIFF